MYPAFWSLRPAQTAAAGTAGCLQQGSPPGTPGEVDLALPFASNKHGAEPLTPGGVEPNICPNGARSN